MNERETGLTVKLQGAEVVKLDHFKYLGLTIQSNEQYTRDVKKTVQTGWSGCKRVSGVICDRRTTAKLKGKIYKMVVRLGMVGQLTMGQGWFGGSSINKKTDGLTGGATCKKCHWE